MIGFSLMEQAQLFSEGVKPFPHSPFQNTLALQRQPTPTPNREPPQPLTQTPLGQQRHKDKEPSRYRGSYRSTTGQMRPAPTAKTIPAICIFKGYLPPQASTRRFPEPIALLDVGQGLGAVECAHGGERIIAR